MASPKPSDAFHVLLTRATPEHLPELHRTLKEHPSSRVRWQIAAILGKVRSPDSVDPLRTALNTDRSLYARRVAAHALGEIGHDSAVEDLSNAMTTDPNKSVRKRAATALSRIGGAKAFRAIRNARQSEQDNAVKLTLKWLLDRQSRPAFKPAPARRGKITQGFFKGTSYLLYLPKGYRPGRRHRLLVSVHGTDGIAYPYAKMCTADADRYNFVVIAPTFDYPTFPNFGYLNREPVGEPSDLRLLQIIDQVANHVEIKKDRFLLFGHSQGGQFVTRFVLAHSDRILRAAACASGHYIHPNPDVLFPNGTKPTPFAPDIENPDFGDLVQTPMAIVIGTADAQRSLDEADRFMKEVHEYAATHQLDCQVKYFEVPGGKHAGVQNYPTAIKFLLSE